jgi:Leucine-rich repeat (LRR) protein
LQKVEDQLVVEESAFMDDFLLTLKFPRGPLNDYEMAAICSCKSKEEGLEELLRCLKKKKSGFDHLLRLCEGVNLQLVEVETGDVHKYTSLMRATQQTSLLRDFYNSTGGCEWKCQKSMKTMDKIWLHPSKPPSEWYGLTADESKDITRIELPNNNCMGSMPSSIGELGTALQVLTLEFNQLQDKIPNSIGGCAVLEELNLKRNQCSGSIPPALGRCTQLKRIILSDNKFTGDIPAALFEGCSKLEEVRLESNQLTGPLPSSMACLRRCRQFVCYRNRLDGPLPTDMSPLRQLVLLDLFSNGLEGSIPPSIVDCKRLTSLNLANNKLSGGVPEGVGKLKLLKTMYLQCNLLTGPLPPSIGKCSKLQQVNCSHNSIDGGLPSLARLKKLQLLDLSHCQLEGQLPLTAFAGCPLLNTLLLCNNPGLNGSITAAHFDGLKGLKLVRLQQCGELDGAEAASELLIASLPALKFEF